jgi:hypothetical protein
MHERPSNVARRTLGPGARGHRDSFCEKQIAKVNHEQLYLQCKSLQVAFGLGMGAILETLFLLLVAVTLAAGFGLIGVYIGARYYY